MKKRLKNWTNINYRLIRKTFFFINSKNIQWYSLPNIISVMSSINTWHFVKYLKFTKVWGQNQYSFGKFLNGKDLYNLLLLAFYTSFSNFLLTEYTGMLCIRYLKELSWVLVNKVTMNKWKKLQVFFFIVYLLGLEKRQYFYCHRNKFHLILNVTW